MSGIGVCRVCEQTIDTTFSEHTRLNLECARGTFPVRRDVLQAPFPWFGGKSRVADIVWSRFGNVANYVEPFAGSLAVPLARPHTPRTETVNDADCYLANFWRSVQSDPEAVAEWADWPVNEADLHARHRWLVEQADFQERMKTDPDFYDAKIAGWWVWGICSWIGSGWCRQRGDGDQPEQLPHLGNAGMGINRKLPHLGDAGRVPQKRPFLSGRGVGVGVNADRSGDLRAYFDLLSDRLRRVRVCCGDWMRVLGPSVTVKHGFCGILLDPPYSEESGRCVSLYSHEDLSIAHRVREWAVANGDNHLLRIALCGYEGEHDMPSGWLKVAWKNRGGYGSQGYGRGADNAHRERIWFSPHCLNGAGPLFDLARGERGEGEGR